MGNEYANLENKVIIKSTSPDRDLIIMCVNSDKNINMIQMREPIIFEDILNQITKMNLKYNTLENNNKFNNLIKCNSLQKDKIKCQKKL